KVQGDFVVVGESNTPAAFTPGGGHVVVGSAGFGEGLRSLVPWLTHGLLLGRPIVPWLGWTWIVAAIFFFINLCVNMLFDGPVRASTVTMNATPFSAFMAGLLVLLLAGPVSIPLMVSVIGIAVEPFVLCAIVAAAVLGRVAFARWIGMTMVRQHDLADRNESLRSFALGSAIMCVTYIIPVIGFMVWILAGVFGLGAATLAFYGAYRRENPKPPKKARPGARPAPGPTRRSRGPFRVTPPRALRPRGKADTPVKLNTSCRRSRNFRRRRSLRRQRIERATSWRSRRRRSSNASRASRSTRSSS